MPWPKLPLAWGYKGWLSPSECSVTVVWFVFASRTHLHEAIRSPFIMVFRNKLYTAILLNHHQSQGVHVSHSQLMTAPLETANAPCLTCDWSQERTPTPDEFRPTVIGFRVASYGGKAEPCLPGAFIHMFYEIVTGATPAASSCKLAVHNTEQKGLMSDLRAHNICCVPLTRLAETFHRSRVLCHNPLCKHVVLKN